MTDPIASICAAIAPICTALDARVTTTPTGPYAVVTAGPATLTTTLGCRPHEQMTCDVMVVQNNPTGCRLVAHRILDALNGLWVDGYRLTHQWTGPLLEDRDDPTEWRWTRTLTLTLTTRRNHDR